MVKNNPTEFKIEKYFVDQVKAYGGEVRKVQWVGRRHAPDRLALFPPIGDKAGFNFFVELKRPGELLRPGQAREGQFLHDCRVPLWPPVYSKETVDALFTKLRESNFIYSKEEVAVHTEEKRKRMLAALEEQMEYEQQLAAGAVADNDAA